MVHSKTYMNESNERLVKYMMHRNCWKRSEAKARPSPMKLEQENDVDLIIVSKSVARWCRKRALSSLPRRH